VFGCIGERYLVLASGACSSGAYAGEHALKRLANPASCRGGSRHRRSARSLRGNRREKVLGFEQRSCSGAEHQGVGRHTGQECGGNELFPRQSTAGSTHGASGEEQNMYALHVVLNGAVGHKGPQHGHRQAGHHCPTGHSRSWIGYSLAGCKTDPSRALRRVFGSSTGRTGMSQTHRCTQVSDSATVARVTKVISAFRVFVGLHSVPYFRGIASAVSRATSLRSSRADPFWLTALTCRDRSCDDCFRSFTRWPQRR
jgi:hypothetical protein